MPAEPQPEAARRHFTVVVESVAGQAWDLRILELRHTWTVAFAADEIEERARTRIALDTGLAPDAFDVDIEPARLFIERRAHSRYD